MDNVKVVLISQGCDKNRVDSEVMLGALAAGGYVFVADLDLADVIIINTCGFLKEAVGEAREAIDEAVKAKRHGSCRAIIVTGCAAQRYKQEITDDYPEIDAVLGVNEYDRLKDFFAGLDWSEGRVLSTPSHYAYLKIAEGCDKTCTYCTIPKIRGPYKSREIDSLIAEASVLVKSGVKELILVAQDTTLYGVDIYGKPMLDELLRQLSKIENLNWLRLLYCYPEHIYPQLVAEISKNPKVLPYIDMPIQHASDAILRLMGRKSNQAQLREIIADLRRAVPGITLRTTLITGFPSETKADFMAVCDFIKEIGFDRLGVFAYSAEEGTPAASLPGHLSDKTKEARKKRLMLLQQDISTDKLAKKVGEIIDVLVEGFDSEINKMYYGRSEADAPEMDGMVFIDNKKALQIGTFVKVRIIQSTEYDLLGVLYESTK